MWQSSLSSHYEKFLATGEVKCIDEEIPFEIPQGWEWARFGNIANHSPQVVCEDNLEVAFMPMTLIDAGYRSSYTFEKRYWKDVKSGFTKMQKGDIAYAKITPCFQNRKSFILCNVPNNTATATTELNVIRIYADTFSQWYILYILKSDYFIKEAKYKGTAGQQRVLSDYVKSKLIPIPPRREQDRICNILHEVLPIVDNYDKSQSELDLLNSTISEKLKKSILQEAIQGKLVPQIPEEGTAQELLEQIRQEKLQLVKEGKLKKSAISDSIIFKGDDNKYYEQVGNEITEIECDLTFPDSWSIVRLGSICSLVDGEKSNGAYPCLDAKFLRGKSTATMMQSGKFVHKADNIILVDGENSGEVFNVPTDGYMGSTFKQLWVSTQLHLPYVLDFILFYKEQLRNSKKGAAIPHLNKDIFYNLIIGIPPITEQKRITNRIEELSQLLK